MKAILYGPPTAQVRDRVHWRQWPARTSCGVGLSTAQQPSDPARGVITCEQCQGLIRTHYPEAQFFVRAQLHDHLRITPDMLGVPSLGPFDSVTQAQDLAKGIRRRMLHWIRQLGSAPQVDVVIDYRFVPRTAFPAVPTHWVALRSQGDSPSHQGDINQGDIPLPQPR
jgi:hypothetical protein